MTNNTTARIKGLEAENARLARQCERLAASIDAALRVIERHVAAGGCVNTIALRIEAEVLDAMASPANGSTVPQGVSIRDFAGAILHGDDEHRAWLLEAAEAFIAGHPMPPARGGGSRAAPAGENGND